MYSFKNEKKSRWKDSAPGWFVGLQDNRTIYFDAESILEEDGDMLILDPKKSYDIMLMQQPKTPEDQQLGRSRITCAARKMVEMPSTPVVSMIMKTSIVYCDKLPEESFIMQAIIKERSGIELPQLQAVRPKGKVIH